MAPSLLDDKTITGWLAAHPDWERVDDQTIRRVVEADSFLAGIALVGRVAEAAESADHHPDIDIRWRTISFALSTHSAGGLTGNDTALAEQIDHLTSAGR